MCRGAGDRQWHRAPDVEVVLRIEGEALRQADCGRVAFMGGVVRQAELHRRFDTPVWPNGREGELGGSDDALAEPDGIRVGEAAWRTGAAEPRVRILSIFQNRGRWGQSIAPIDVDALEESAAACSDAVPCPVSGVWPNACRRFGLT